MIGLAGLGYLLIGAAMGWRMVRQESLTGGDAIACGIGLTVFGPALYSWLFVREIIIAWRRR